MASSWFVFRCSSKRIANAKNMMQKVPCNLSQSPRTQELEPPARSREPARLGHLASKLPHARGQGKTLEELEQVTPKFCHTHLAPAPQQKKSNDFVALLKIDLSQYPWLRTNDGETRDSPNGKEEATARSQSNYFTVHAVRKIRAHAARAGHLVQVREAEAVLEDEGSHSLHRPGAGRWPSSGCALSQKLEPRWLRGLPTHPPHLSGKRST